MTVRLPRLKHCRTGAACFDVVHIPYDSLKLRFRTSPVPSILDRLPQLQDFRNAVRYILHISLFLLLCANGIDDYKMFMAYICWSHFLFNIKIWFTENAFPVITKDYIFYTCVLIGSINGHFELILYDWFCLLMAGHCYLFNLCI